jgi:hypothetical protein
MTMNQICKLCGHQKVLLKSHILPKSFTKRMRAGAPQVVAVVMHETPSASKVNGEYVARLLCADCELLIKTLYEDYGTRLFVNRRNITENNSHVFIESFQYEKYFLFILSILWRASISSLEIYKATLPLAEVSELFKSCIKNNTLKTHPPYNLRLDTFLKMSILKIVDHTSEIPQSTLDSVMHGINLRPGASIEEGLHYYFMVDGFLVCASLFKPQSPFLQNWRADGRLLNRSTLKIPKVSFYGIKEIYEGIAAIASTPDPFATQKARP